RSVGALDLDRVRIEDARGAVEDLREVPVVEAGAELDLSRDHAIRALHEIRERDLVAVSRVAEERIGPELHESVDRLAEGLARNRAGVRAAAPDRGVLLDDRDALSELRGLHRGALAAGARTDDDDVEPRSVHRAEYTPRPAARPRFRRAFEAA